MVADTVRCPWHHACFSLRTTEPMAAPALTATSCGRVERRDGAHLRAREGTGNRTPHAGEAAAHHWTARADVIIGGGAAGYAAAEMLRREGFGGEVTIVSADDAPP